jgi:photosystem II stability/assembly factor-like uncharacterized protein
MKHFFLCRIASLAAAFIVLAVSALTQSFAQQPSVKLTSGMFGAVEARHLGPATMSGRITSIDVIDKKINNEPNAPLQRIIYVGAASGGVWKSKDNGTTFKPIFDKTEKASQSIGALAIDRSKPDEVIWVGTGESNTRNSVSVGTGIYKSTDGGDSWKLMGLEKSERIARIAIHPKNPDVVFVAVPGALWSDSEDRGLYRTTDGGKTWEKALYIDSKTGCAEVVIDPADPNIMYASMWTFRRKGWSFASGGKDGGLFKSTDGGKTWRKLTKDLPDGEVGRVAIALAPSTSATVYAIVEAKKTRLWRSTNKGENWEAMSDATALGLRPFYFASLVVDPTDPNIVYKPALDLNVSTDGGKTFSAGGTSTHSDHHALWIDPQNPMVMLLGTDGGVYRSLDRGRKWLMIRSLPVSQFYHVGVDNEVPYNVFGGLQDNGSWMAPSQASGGITNSAWKSVGFGDGFHVLRDRTDKNVLYFEYQGGEMSKHYLATGEIKFIKPQPKDGDPKYRFNWNTPLAQSPKNPKTLYAGAQFLFRSMDKGESWEKISPDLTTNDSTKQKQEESGGLSIDISAAENHCTIYAITESPFDEKIIWAGTDDGNLQLTQDGGKKWTNVVTNIQGLPKNAWVSCIEPSRYDKATAYVTFDLHTFGDMATYVYKTTDFGKTWTRLESPEFRGYAHVVREDAVNKNLLFVGTEMGLFVSLDGGAQWVQFTGNLPNVAIRDIAIQARENDLVLATHGRGIVVIDDITPLRALSAEVLGSELAILPSRPARHNWSNSFQTFDGDDEFVGDNPSQQATITYYMKDRMMMGDLKVEVLNDKGEVISSIPGTKRKGINRVNFAMRMKAPRVAASENLAPRALFGPLLPEGKYTVRITKGEKQFTSTLVLEGDPRSPYTAADRAAQQKTVMSLYNIQARLAYISAAMTELRDTLKARVEKLDSTNKTRVAVMKTANRLDSLYKTVAKERGFYVAEKEDKLREHVSNLYGAVNSYGGAPSKMQLERLATLEREIGKVNTTLESIIKTDLLAANTELKTASLQAASALTKEEFDKRQQ